VPTLQPTLFSNNFSLRDNYLGISGGGIGFQIAKRGMSGGGIGFQIAKRGMSGGGIGFQIANRGISGGGIGFQIANRGISGGGIGFQMLRELWLLAGTVAEKALRDISRANRIAPTTTRLASLRIPSLLTLVVWDSYCFWDR